MPSELRNQRAGFQRQRLGFERFCGVWVKAGMTVKLPSALAVFGFVSAILMFSATFTNRLSFPLHSLSASALFVCSAWLALGFWFCARGMVTSQSEELRQLARFGLYIHGIVLFASGAGLGA
jgi:hypothetical protein